MSPPRYYYGNCANPRSTGDTEKRPHFSAAFLMLILFLFPGCTHTSWHHRQSSIEGKFNLGDLFMSISYRGSLLPTIIVDGGAGSASEDYRWLQVTTIIDRACRPLRSRQAWGRDPGALLRSSDRIVDELHRLPGVAKADPPVIQSAGITSVYTNIDILPK